MSNYTAYVAECAAHITDAAPTAYLKGRGLSLEGAKALGIGYDPDKHTMVIPLEPTQYRYRTITADGTAADFTKALKNADGGRAFPFNVHALDGTDAVTIVEGWEDACAIHDAGGTPVALNGTSGKTAFIDEIKKRTSAGRSIPPLILGLDNDEPGRAAAEWIRSALHDLEIPCVHDADLFGAANDANDALRTNHADLEAKLRSAADKATAVKNAVDATIVRRSVDALAADTDAAIDAVLRDARADLDGTYDPTDDPVSRMEREAKEQALLDELERGSMGISWYAEFVKRIQAAENARISSGIPGLDAALGGRGLYPGFYVVGGMTGTGKSSLVLQMVDNFAKQGRPVLYVSLEMGKEELTAKSVSRLIWEKDHSNIIPWEEIIELKSVEPTDEKWLRAWQDCVWNSTKEYCETKGENLKVVEGVAATTAPRIRELAEKMADLDGQPPVVVVDYLQILAPTSDRLTDKQAADKNVVELKRLSRDLTTPVIAISAFNRASYKLTDKDGNPLKGKALIDALHAAFRESSAIEYTADVLLGLREVHSTEGYAWKEVELYVLKNRRGKKSSEPVHLSFCGEVGAFVGA